MPSSARQALSTAARAPKPCAAGWPGYLKPYQDQRTNRRNRLAIVELLGRSEAVEILALVDPGLLRYGTFHLNLAAALEDSIIQILKPEWNGGRTSSALETPAEADLPLAVPSRGRRHYAWNPSWPVSGLRPSRSRYRCEPPTQCRRQCQQRPPVPSTRNRGWRLYTSPSCFRRPTTAGASSTCRSIATAISDATRSPSQSIAGLSSWQ